MAYLVLAYPQFSQADFRKIQYYREIHDELYFSIVEPHFTLVFPVFDVCKKDFIVEARKKSLGFQPFDFTIRCATINKDAFSSFYHVLLVPDEGYSRIVKLHDKLYSGILENDLRMDINFVPHIGVGNTLSQYQCKDWVDAWNDQDFEIKGRVERLSVVRYENDTITTIMEWNL